MYHVEQEHWECGECARGQFGWLNECVACPPGKSTVNMGASYDQCIPSRYIKCEIHMDDKDGKKKATTAIIYYYLQPQIILNHAKKTVHPLSDPTHNWAIQQILA